MKILNKDTYILAAVTGTLYFQAFIGILAQAIFYQIPLELMTLDVMRVVWQSLFFISCFIVLALFSWLYNLFKRKRSRNLLKLLMIGFFIYFPATAYYLVMGFNKAYAVVFSVLVLWAEIAFIVKNKKHLSEVFNGESWHYDEWNGRGIIDVIIYYRVFMTILILIAVFPGAFVMSYINYHNKIVYEVFFDKDYFAIVNYSADNILAKKIENHQLSNGYYIFKTDAMEGKEIKKINIQLIPEEAPSGSPASPARLASLR
ncbi:hypothetical protein WKH21_19755 [Pantoea agglomerans]|uniref:hypothetical protein n=1 Tax=Enterobacter agglomerans TaxID=549 RepID=UPI003C7D3E32